MDDWRKTGLKTAKTPAVMRKKGYKPVPVGIKKCPKILGREGNNPSVSYADSSLYKGAKSVVKF